MKNLVKIGLILVGWLSIVLGTLGIFLPVLPTTPFLLLAAACFARSSERFHGWLMNNQVFGPIIKDWQENRSLDPNVKRWALCMVVLSFSFSIFMVNNMPLRVCLLIGMIACLTGIARVPVIKAPSD